MIPTRQDAYGLIHQGALALADIERHGFAIDTDYLKTAIAETGQRIDRLKTKLHEDEVWTRWKKKYRDKAKLGSGKQLKVILQDLGYEIKSKDVDEEALSSITDLPFAKRYLRLKKLQKAKTTYLEGILEEVVDGYLHCFFNLHTVRTFRSSSDSPNLQNQPVRDPEIGELIRRAFVPRSGFQLLEIDYGALEVRIIACYSQDSYLIEHLDDPHTEWAQRCFLLDKKQVTKNVRYVAKNKFVFPEFYGSYYVDCAKNMWDAIPQMNLETADGTLLFEHLESKGIKKLGKCNPEFKPVSGTFEYHTKKMEEEFRYKKHSEHTQWREQRWEEYKKKGYIETLTGFKLGEVYRRNQIINSPIQGSGFHCLLWSLTELNKRLKKHKFESRLICQVHDSMVLDCKPSELQDVMAMVKQISTEEVRDHWSWITVPLLVEAELCPVDKSWYEKKGTPI